MPELSTGAQIAVMLIVLSVVISVVFTILGFVRAATAEGMTSVQNALDAMILSQFDDYDQKVMSGSQVISALKLMEGKPVAMVVVNQKPNAALLLSGSTQRSLFTDQNQDKVWKGVNYGAVLNRSMSTMTIDPDTGSAYTLTFESFTTDATAWTDTSGKAGKLGRGGSYSWYIQDLWTDASDGLAYNQNLTNVYRSGKGEFIRTTAKYQARLIKDTTGTIVGACFVQIK